MSKIKAAIRQYVSYPAMAPVERVLRNGKLFSIVLGISFCLFAIVVMILPKKYESEMKFLVSTERPGLVISPDDSKNNVAHEELPDVRVGSEIELLKSRDVMEQVLDKTGLGNRANAKDQSPAATAAYREAVINSLLSHLKMEPIKKSEILSVTYRARSPEMANNVLRSLADAYLQLHLRAHATPGSFKFFDDQAKSYAEQLAQAEHRMTAFREKHPDSVQSDQVDPSIQRALDVQAALDETRAQESDYNRRVKEGFTVLSSLQPRVATQIHVSPQSSTISQLTGLLAELENRRTEMATKFLPDDRMVTQLDKEISDTKAALDAVSTKTMTDQTSDLNAIRVEAEKSLNASEVMLAGLMGRRRELDQQVKDHKRVLMEDAAAAVELERLTRQLKESEENYLLYSKKREEARISESLDQERITDVSLIESPTVPVQPVSPLVSLDLAIGFLLSLLVAFLSVVLKDRLGLSPSVTRHASATSTYAVAPSS